MKVECTCQSLRGNHLVQRIFYSRMGSSDVTQLVDKRKSKMPSHARNKHSGSGETHILRGSAFIQQAAGLVYQFGRHVFVDVSPHQGTPP